ncbi:MAG: hypothetical protein AAF787_10715 [Chloroflexota bacterium]
MPQTRTTRNLMILAIGAVVFYIAHIVFFPFFGSDYLFHFHGTADVVLVWLMLRHRAFAFTRL